MTNLKVGDVLIAKDECLMDNGEKALTIGKEYTIRMIGQNYISLIDDENDMHEFTTDENYKENWRIFFTTKELQTANLTAKQTVLEFVIDKVTNLIHESRHLELVEIFEQAKQLEKEQIEDA